MSFDLNYWLKETIDVDNAGGILIYQKIRPRIVCQDGYSVSVQASEYAYTVYGYIPVDIVEKLIEKHGGYKCAKKGNIDDAKENDNS